jgi:hypothetical protein
MVIVKVLGGIDIVSAIAFLMLIFGIDVFTRFLLFCAGLLLLKGLFIFTGDVLSVIDLYSSTVLVVAIFFVPPAIFLWIPIFLLTAKGFISFL